MFREEGAVKMKRRAIIVDIDGTVADMDKDNPLARGPYEWDRVGEDMPHKDVISLVRILKDAAGYAVIFVSGRDETSRQVTEDWIDIFVQVDHHGLYMRPSGDRRPDTVVKEEIYLEEIEPRYDVKFVFDDRDKVVAMWRSHGLRVLQVAHGDF